MEVSRLCDYREASPSTYGVTEVEIFEIAVAFLEGVKKAQLKCFFSEGNRGSWKPINILRLGKARDHRLPPTP